MRRFDFGKNWTRFVYAVDEVRIKGARESLLNWIDSDELNKKTFLDIGCGSGIHSLVAQDEGALVTAFDYDKDSVRATKMLFKKFHKKDPGAMQGSILDEEFLAKQLLKYDIVYSWGVLHHTGNMAKAIRNTVRLVDSHGLLYIAIYNKQTYFYKTNILLKKIYTYSPKILKFFLAIGFSFVRIVKGFVKDLVTFKNPFLRYKIKKTKRGMSVVIDAIDWLGGYPYEAATPEEIIHTVQAHGFSLRKLKTTQNGHGCNEFLFVKNS